MDSSTQRILDTLVGPGEPGAVITIYRGGSVDDVFCAGLASLEYDQKVTPDTIFNIGSCSKQFTGAAAALLHEDGLVDLDAPIREYLPELPIGHAVSVRQCLNHTAGLYDYPSVDDIAGLPVGAMATESDVLEYLARQRSTQFPPGTSIAYSNTNFVAAAIAMQRAAGKPFGQLLRERIFTPLEMRHSRIRDRVGLVVPDMAFSYDPAGEGYLRHEMPEALPGDSNVLTSANDLAPWFGFLTDGRILGESIRAQLMTPARLADGTATSYALGLTTGWIAGMTYISHSGSHYGFRAFVLCVPERNVAVAVLANRSDLSMQELVAHLIDRHVAAPRPVSAPLAQATAAAAAGNWYAAEVNEMLRVRAESTGLTVTDIGTPRALAPSGPSSWSSWDGPPSLQLADEHLIWVSRLGRQTRYERLVEQDPAASPLTGTFRSAEHGLCVEVVGSNDRLSYRPGKRPAIALAYVGTIGESFIYYAGWDVLAFTVAADGSVTLALRSENASLAGFVRDPLDKAGR